MLTGIMRLQAQPTPSGLYSVSTSTPSHVAHSLNPTAAEVHTAFSVRLASV